MVQQHLPEQQQKKTGVQEKKRKAVRKEMVFFWRIQWCCSKKRKENNEKKSVNGELGEPCCFVLSCSVFLLVFYTITKAKKKKTKKNACALEHVTTNN